MPLLDVTKLSESTQDLLVRWAEIYSLYRPRAASLLGSEIEKDFDATKTKLIECSELKELSAKIEVKIPDGADDGPAWEKVWEGVTVTERQLYKLGEDVIRNRSSNQ